MSYIGNEPIVSATRTITELTATAGQTVFTANGGYTVGYIDVYVNGAQLQNADLSASNGSTVTLNQAASLNDTIRLVAWGTFSVTLANAGQYFGTASTKAIAYNANTVSEDITITNGNNGLSAGPITINTGYTVTVETGATWVIV